MSDFEQPMMEETGYEANLPQFEDEDSLSQEEMKGTLSDMMTKVQDKFGELNSDIFIGRNKTEGDKEEKIKEVLQLLEGLGVDVNDQNSIQKFLNNFQQTNPDLYILFQEAFDALLGGDLEEPPVDEPMPLEEMPQPDPTADMTGLPGLSGPPQELPPTPGDPTFQAPPPGMMS